MSSFFILLCQQYREKYTEALHFNPLTSIFFLFSVPAEQIYSSSIKQSWWKSRAAFELAHFLLYALIFKSKCRRDWLISVLALGHCDIKTNQVLLKNLSLIIWKLTGKEGHEVKQVVTTKRANKGKGWQQKKDITRIFLHLLWETYVFIIYCYFKSSIVLQMLDILSDGKLIIWHTV